MSPEEAVRVAAQILAKIPDLPERAEVFAASVEERTLSIKSQVETRGRVTPGQVQALENMLAGVERWAK